MCVLQEFIETTNEIRVESLDARTKHIKICFHNTDASTTKYRILRRYDSW